MDEETSRLEIFGDSPTTEDGLGFDDYADILLGMIGNFDAKSSLTIGIHGRWGSGKTSLMRMVEKRFGDDEGVKTVWFNAWAYGDEPIGLALLQQILNEFQKEDGLKEKGKTLLENVVKLGTDALLRKSTTTTSSTSFNAPISASTTPASPIIPRANAEFLRTDTLSSFNFDITIFKNCCFSESDLLLIASAA